MTRWTTPAALDRLPLLLVALLPLLLLGLDIACTSANSERPKDKPGEQAVVEVQMTAQRFEFNPARVEVKEGSRLVLKISSLDVKHGFNIIGTRTDVIIPSQGEGQVTVVFEASTKGTFRFKCSKVCGSGHSDMKGVIVVQ